ncbi:MAG: hypothetical protein H6739_09690 [Alphaproteobacteria bacterium]|nr:hypothetical protein [Alphaproteobacteria bacterium]
MPRFDRFLLMAGAALSLCLGAAVGAQEQPAEPTFLPVELGPGSLVYHWPEDEPLHYRIQMYLSTPYGTRFYASENLDARVSEMTMALLLKCRAKPPEEKYQSMACEIHRVELGGATRTGEDHKVREIFAEYVQDLSAATIQVEMTPRGRVRTVDLEGIEKGYDRQALKHEYLRLVVSRGLSALEVEMPKDGDPRDKPWRQKGSPLAMRLPVPTGTAGGVRMMHEVLGASDDGVVIRSIGQGTLQQGGTASTATISAFLSGQAVFDTERKVLVKNEQTFQGVFTAQAGNTGRDLYISQVTMIDLLPDFEELDAQYRQRLQSPPKSAGEVLSFDKDQGPGEHGSALRQALGLPDEPGVDAPGVDEPGSDEPGVDAPGSEEPGVDAPGVDAPGVDAPAPEE